MAVPTHVGSTAARAVLALLHTLRHHAASAGSTAGRAGRTGTAGARHRRGGTTALTRLRRPVDARTRTLLRRVAAAAEALFRRTAVGAAVLDRLAHWWRAGSARPRVVARAVGDLVAVLAAMALLLGGPAGNRLRTRRTPLARHARPTRAIGAAGLVTAGILVVGLVIAVAAALPSGPTVPARSALADSLDSRQLAADRADRGNRPAPAGNDAATAGSSTTAAGPAATPTKTPDWVNPIPGVPLSSCYGARWGSVHQGIDFAGAAGTPILAAGAGTVFAAGWTYAGYGISIMIDHGNGLYSHYAHAEQALVTVGQHVVAGQPIALEGTTGDSTGPHLHFEIHEGLWHQVDPAPWLRAHGVSVGC
jgi:murein DD-endopeptidase MepM/ murein hydrolase activator NlpD